MPSSSFSSRPKAPCSSMRTESTTYFSLLPALTEPELELLEARMPCPIPPDISELLRFTNGFNVGGGIEEVGFSGLQGGFGMEEIFPHSIPLAADGFGNYWVLDLTSESRSWGPIFYACHDAPVIVYRTDSPLHFVQEAIRFGNKPWKSELNDVHEGQSHRIWRENPGVLTYAQCLRSEDPGIRAFAQIAR